jgi:hypothetical protein
VVQILLVFCAISIGHFPICSSMVLRVCSIVDLHQSISSSKIMLENVLLYNHLVVVVLTTCPLQYVGTRVLI